MSSELDLYSVVMLIGLGGLAGFLGGLIGIGGGMILVPGFYYAFTHMGIAPGDELMLALGTAMAGIFFTAWSASRAHARRGLVRGDMVREMAPWLAAGAMVGAALATVLDPSLVTAVFAAFCLISACRWLFLAPKDELGVESVEPACLDFVGPMLRIAKPRNRAVGVVFGSLCGMIGVGGTTLFVPFMMKHKLCTRQAMATGSALQIPVSIAGALAYVVLGWTEVDAPGTLGFIYVPALVVAGVSSFFAAPLGARVSRAMSVVALRKTFGVLSAGVGLKMAGAFAFLATVIKDTPW